jgi:hypothetical protein
LILYLRVTLSFPRYVYDRKDPASLCSTPDNANLHPREVHIQVFRYVWYHIIRCIVWPRQSQIYALMFALLSWPLHPFCFCQTSFHKAIITFAPHQPNTLVHRDRDISILVFLDQSRCSSFKSSLWSPVSRAANVAS